MPEVVTLRFSDDHGFDRILKKTKNARPAMAAIERTVLVPLRVRAWRGSGLRSVSGELRGAVKTWHGRRSAGISVRSKPGHDLIIPKAVAHAHGARRHEWRRKKTYRVRGHRRSGATVKSYSRRNPGAPWGRLRARPFIPVRLSASETAAVRRILLRMIHV